MKELLLPVLSVFLALNLCCPRSMAQQKPEKVVSFHLKNVTLKDAIQTLERQSNLHIFYNSDLGARYFIEDIDITNETPNSALSKLLRNTSLAFKIINPSGDLALVPKTNRPDRVVRGKIINGGTGEPLAGVTIREKDGVNGTISDGNGNFVITVRNATPIIVASYIGFINQEIQIGANTVLNIRLRESSQRLNEVVVQARRKVNNEISLLKDRKNAAIVTDGISAQNIEKTASITTTQALQRVSGVTITDDKYVAIRGLGERAVIAELNGARLSSANPDRSSVPLDLVPAALLDNITVYKTLTPDHPADASAGIVELKTKSVPDSLTVQFIAQGGFNSTIGLGGYYNSFKGNDPGFFAQRVKDHDLSGDFTNLKKQYPGGSPEIQRFFFNSRNSPALTKEAYRINDIMLSFPPVLSSAYQPAQPNQIYTFSAGDAFKVFGHELGVIFSANYYRRFEDRYQAESNQWSLYQGIVTGSLQIFSPLHIPNFITPEVVRLGKYLGYHENSGTQTINYGVLAGLTYKLNAYNQLSFQVLGSRGAETGATSLIGSYENTNLRFPVYSKVYKLNQSYRIFNTYNFQGEHRFFAQKTYSTLISYNLSKSISSTDEPDNRTVDLATYRKQLFLDATGVGLGSDVYALVDGITLQPGSVPIASNPNQRRFRKLNENNYNGKIDLTQSFTLLGRQQLFKAGYYYLKRDRNFTDVLLGLPGTAAAGGDNGIIAASKGNVDYLVSYNNIGLKSPANYDQIGTPRVGGFLYQSQKSPYNYRGNYLVRSFYGMLDLHVTRDLRLTGGTRFESTSINAFVDIVGVYHEPIPTNLVQYGVTNRLQPIKPQSGFSNGYTGYTSLNLTYSLLKNMNLRLAFSKTLARPELREITNIFEFDPAQFAVIGGNPLLKNQNTYSYDFRYEWFPKPNEVLSISFFYKRILNQLTKAFYYYYLGPTSTFEQFPLIKYFNDPEPGKVYGIELEARKDLGKIWFPLKNFFIGSNLLVAASVVQKNTVRLTASRTIDRRSPATSPVFEQPPYSANVYLDYYNVKSKSNATVSFNEVGERLTQVQLDGAPDIYSRPVPLLDFVFSQQLGRRFIVKGFAKNLLDPAYRYTYSNPGHGGLFYGEEYLSKRYFRGREFSLGITFNLF